MDNYIDLEELRLFLNYEILRDPTIMYNDYIRGTAKEQEIDLIGVIVGMYEMLHRIIKGEKYNYMFHWANKCGSWVETDYLKILIDAREGR